MEVFEIIDRAGADPKGVQWGCSNSPFGKNYFIFMGILWKFRNFMGFCFKLLIIVQNEPHFPKSRIQSW